MREVSADGMGNPVATAEGMRARSRSKIRRHSTRECFGSERHKWGNQDLAAYTLCRTNKGPQYSWLHKIRKRPDSDCPECGDEEAGEHIVFWCPAHGEERRKLGEIQGWEDHDKPRWKGEGANRYDAVEDFIYYCYQRISRRQQRRQEEEEKEEGHKLEARRDFFQGRPGEGCVGGGTPIMRGRAGEGRGGGRILIFKFLKEDSLCHS